MTSKRPKLGAVFSSDAPPRSSTELPAARTVPTTDDAAALERVVQLNVAVPESLRRRVKIKALQSGKDMNTILREILTAWVEE